jgi:hypothetical protein
MDKPIIKIGPFEFSPGEARMIQRALNDFEWPERVEDDLKTPDALPNFEPETSKR